MSDCFTIVDLDHLERSKKIEIVGGYVSTVAHTSADYDSAFAYSDAAAYGQSTYTDTNARTLAQRYTSAFLSYAKASATAYAYNGIQERSYYRSTSIYYSGG
jgi:hypothetical protein